MVDKEFVELLETHKDELALLVAKHMPKFRAILEINGIQGVIETAYETLDLINEQSGLNDKVSCAGECNFCCYGNIDISTFEATYIVSFIDQFKVDFNKEQLKRQSRKPFHKLKYADKRCSMINDEGKCGIYSIRPDRKSVV